MRNCIRIAAAIAGLLAADTLASPGHAQTASGAPIDAAFQLILANPKVVKTLEDIMRTTMRRWRNRSASPKFRRRPTRRKSGPNTS